MNTDQESDPRAREGPSRTRARRVLAVIGAVVLLTGAALWSLLWLPPSARWLATRILSAPLAESSIGVEVGSARLWRLGSVRLEHLRLIRADGSVLASVDTLSARYQPAPLIRRTLSVPTVRLVSPKLDLRKVQGTWEASTLAPRDTTAAPWTVELGQMAVDGGTAQVSTDGEEVGRVSDLMLRASELALGERVTVNVDSLFFMATAPGVPGPAEVILKGGLDGERIQLDTLSLVSPSSRASASGSASLSAANPFDLRRPARVDLRVEAPHVLLGDLGFLGANLNPAGALAATAHVESTTPGQMEAAARIDFLDGARLELEALLEEDGSEDREAQLAASVEVEGLDPSYVVTDGPAGAIHASAKMDLNLIPRVDSASGTSVVGEASVQLGESFLNDLRLEPGRLALALEGSAATFEYDGVVVSTTDIPTSGEPLRAQVQTQGEVRRGERLGYSGQAELIVSGLSPERLTLLAELEGSGSGPDSLRGTLNVQMPEQTAFGQTLEAHLTYRPELGAGPWSLALNHGSGTLNGEGRVALGDIPGVTVSQLIADRLDLGAWVRDSLPSLVSGRADGELRGTSGPLLSGGFDVSVASATIRGRSLPPATGSIQFESGTVTVRAGSTDSVPTWSVRASARPFDTPPSVTIQRGEIRGLDPAALAQDTIFRGSINGSVSGALRGYDLTTATGNLEMTLDSSRVAEQTFTGGRGSFGLAEGVLGGRFLLEYPSGEADGQTQVRFGEGGWANVEVSDVSFRGLDLAGFAPSTLQLSTSLDGTLDGAVARNVEGPVSGEVSLLLAESTVNRANIQSGTLTARVSQGRLTADGRVAVGGGGSVDMNLSASLDSTRFADGEAQVDFHLPELGALLGADSPASIRGHLDIASLDPDAGEWAFRGSAWEGTWENLSLDTAVVAGRASRRIIEVDTITGSGNAFRADGGGMIVLDATPAATPSFTMTAELTDALPLAPFIEAEVFEVGTATANLRFGRTPDAIVFEGQVDANAILIDEFRVVGVTGNWFMAGTGIRQVDTAHVTVGVGRIAGPIAAEVASTDVEAHYDGDQLVVEAVAGIDEGRDGDLRAIVDPTSRGRRFEVERFRFSIDEDVWRLDDGFEVDWTDGFRVGGANLVAGDQRIAFEGGIHASEPDSFNLRTENFRIGTISDLLGFPEVEATVSSDLVLTGSLSNPEWTFDAEGEVQRRGQDRGSVAIGLSYGSDRLDTEVTLRDRTNHSVSLSGFVPIDLDFSDPGNVAREAPGDADLRIQADSFDIQWFSPFVDPELVSGLGGIISVDAQVRGRTNDPLLSGQARVAGARLSLVRLGTEYSDINATLRLDNRTIGLENASLSDGDGDADLSGSFALESLGLGRFDLSASLDEFLIISNARSRARTSGEVRLRGTTEAPRVEGNVEVVSADVYLEGQSSAVSGRQLEEVELTEEDLATLRELFGYSPPEDEPDVSALVTAASARLDIVVGRDSWLRQRMNPELAVQLSGELSVEKEAGSDPRVVGTISPVPGRSYVEQWGRRFEMQSGQIVFRGPPLQPEVQLTASYAIPSRENPGASEVVIQLDVEGRPDSLRLILSSTPSMDNADIVSYIATGRPAAQSLSGSEGTPNVTDVGVELAADRLTSAIEGFAADAVGLDVVEIRREGTGDAVLVAGRYVSPRLYIGFQQPVSFGSGDGPARESTGQRAEIEYQAFRWLLLNLEGGRSDVEFFFRTRYGY